MHLHIVMPCIYIYIYIYIYTHIYIYIYIYTFTIFKLSLLFKHLYIFVNKFYSLNKSNDYIIHLITKHGVYILQLYVLITEVSICDTLKDMQRYTSMNTYPMEYSLGGTITLLHRCDLQVIGDAKIRLQVPGCCTSYLGRVSRDRSNR